MSAEKLVHMANQITHFFRAYSEEVACAGIREHIESFWTQKMRAELLTTLASGRLDPLVVRALNDHPNAGQSGTTAASR